jgi:hypothetical protein
LMTSQFQFKTTALPAKLGLVVAVCTAKFSLKTTFENENHVKLSFRASNAWTCSRGRGYFSNSKATRNGV